jgi:hypothetical protein
MTISSSRRYGFPFNFENCCTRRRSGYEGTWCTTNTARGAVDVDEILVCTQLSDLRL